jgi:hypothetical protein
MQATEITVDTITVKPTRPRKAFVSVLTEWMQKWARVHSLRRRDPIVLTEEHFAIYGEALADLSPERLDAACRRATEVCESFPTPADIRAQLDDADEKGFELEAERAWDWSLDVARRCYFADLGGLRDAPSIAPAIEFAVKAAGGWRRLHTCSEDELVWCRKIFLERYRTLHETGQVEHLLSDGEAKRILAQLHAAPKGLVKQIAPPKEESVSKPPHEEVSKVLCQVAGLESRPEPEAQPHGAIETALALIRDAQKTAAQLEKELPTLKLEPRTEEERRRGREIVAQVDMLQRTRPELFVNAADPVTRGDERARES